MAPLQSSIAGARSMTTSSGGVSDLSIVASRRLRARFARSALPQTSRRSSAATVVCGAIGDGETLGIVSQMPRAGAIFSDGMEEDYLAFDAGMRATIGVSSRTLELCWPAFSGR